MIKKAITVFLLIALAAALFAACSQKETDETAVDETMRDYTAFAGKRIGAQTGEIYVLVAQDILMAGEVPEYPTITDLLESLKMGRTDAVITDSSYIEPLIDSGAYPEFDYVWVPKDVYSNESAVVLHTEELRGAFNKWLADIISDGTMAEMEERWLRVSLPNEEDIPKFTLIGENGVLRVCDTGDYPPFSYFDSNGDYCGMDYELISRFAKHMGMTLDVTMMSYAAIAPYVDSGKADMSACYLTISGERGQSMIFSDPVVSTQGVLIVPKAGAAADGAQVQYTGITAWLKTGIERNLITDNRWKMVASGLGVTMTIAVLAQILGTAFGAFVCWLLTRKNRFVRLIGNLYCGLIYGTPIVVLLMITYYIIFGNTSISNVLVAVFAFTMITGASVAANLKGSIETVDTVEIEAARSIGFTAFKAFRAVTLPQAVRRALPGYTNGFVELVKATAIVGYIAIQDLTRAGDIIRSRTYDAYFPLLFVAVIYLIVTTVCVQIFKLIVKKVNKGGAA